MKFVLGLLVGLFLLPVVGYLYLTSGKAPVATSDPEIPFEKALVRKALHARMDPQIPKKVAIDKSEANYLAGAQLYKQHCAVCHGLPDAPKSAVAAGMYPRPPQLFHGKGVTDDEPGESYWKISNGIRLTGMPGFSATLSETQMWQMAILLADADKLPALVKSALAVPAAPAAGGN